MFSHVMVGTNDLNMSRSFYDAAFGALGLSPGFPDEKGRIFWMAPGGFFAITKPINGEDACHANGGTIGFAMTSPEQADSWHSAGIAAGGASCEDPPGWREGGFGPMYLAYLRDPAGNKLCGVHIPQRAT
ncbi:VOC family protein [Sphingomonas sp. BIUV-7]|uniref:VOC family protein n=1 Tax=Sphingomonas natans TaxID=3063330 RepID=A0ABT8YC07_9SPHN|nr:VOC family protein [Sphingomonas sp. BIUV-7]MDO6415854.1 VOC family protein [Sphingomonas sp. BIUV-7]